MSNVAKDVIKKEMILLQQDAKTKEEVLHYLVETAAENQLITAQQPFLEAVLNRESEVPTAIGYQIAIPHGKSSTVSAPFIGFLQTKEDFIWTQGHEEEVKLIFLIGVPLENENNIHLKFISQLSKKLLDETFRAQLLAITDVNQAYELLSSITI
ncbi:PTS sugar transporter subunit IIA [Isobaculum melis]|uniref:PTS system IIA component, Fru family n=1 Tax=Isobaculum melis TaxID=142588 RepID=A0A1H9QTN7_9LACT|nr:PTS sugar transporter subunit IIA [Isobaculum melis]SER63790.1 PTS system IIA component, Fru family [Isobaculum melis]